MMDSVQSPEGTVGARKTKGEASDATVQHAEVRVSVKGASTAIRRESMPPQTRR
jgi:hypothetical protein